MADEANKLTVRQQKIREIIEDCCEIVNPKYRDVITPTGLNEAAMEIEDICRGIA